MRPQVSPALRKEVTAVVRRHDLLPIYRWIRARTSPWFDSVLPDVQYFRSQTRELERRSMPQFAVSLRDGGPDGDSLPVLVQVPDLRNLKTSYERLLDSLHKSNLPLDKVTPEAAEEIFVERLAEFLAVESIAVPSTPTDTIVNSNRSGDTVIYANGFFHSTGTAFGVSTPAVAQLSGRYSFGIMDSGNPKFDNIVWSCPAIVQLDLP